MEWVIARLDNEKDRLEMRQWADRLHCKHQLNYELYWLSKQTTKSIKPISMLLAAPLASIRHPIE